MNKCINDLSKRVKDTLHGHLYNVLIYEFIYFFFLLKQCMLSVVEVFVFKLVCVFIWSKTSHGNQ